MAVDPQTRQIIFSQQRFFNFNDDANEDSASWWVPVTYCTFVEDGCAASNSPAMVELPLSAGSTIVGTGTDSTSLCVKANLGTIGFFRVGYTAQGWECLLHSFTLFSE